MTRGKWEDIWSREMSKEIINCQISAMDEINSRDQKYRFGIHPNRNENWNRQDAWVFQEIKHINSKWPRIVIWKVLILRSGEKKNPKKLVVKKRFKEEDEKLKTTMFCCKSMKCLMKEEVVSVSNTVEASVTEGWKCQMMWYLKSCSSS